MLANYVSTWRVWSGERRNSLSSGNYPLPILLAGRDLDEPIIFSIRDGEVALFTHASPMPSHDNEDAVGVFDWKGETVVLVVADGLGGLPRVRMLHNRWLKVSANRKLKRASIRWSLASSL